jgi:uncharacterized protein
MTLLRREGADLLIDIRLTPRGGCDRIAGVRRLDDGRMLLAMRVSAAPEDGKANKALEALVARAAGVARSAVTIVAGQQSRLKRLKISGIQPEEDSVIAGRLGL